MSIVKHSVFRYPLFLLFATLITSSAYAQYSVQTEYKGAALHFRNPGGFNLRIANTYTLDAACFVPTFDASKATIGEEPFQINPYLGFTNIQTELSGSFNPRCGYQFHFNYANGKIRLLNMLFDYRLSEHFKLAIGQMKVPGPMSKNYSTRSAMSMDTPLGLSLSSSRRFGLALYRTTNVSYAALGVYTVNLNNFSTYGLPEEPEVGVAGRYVYNLINRERERLLLGGNIYWMRMANGYATETRSIGIETKTSKMRVVNYALIDNTSQLNYGLELAYQRNKFLLTGEVLGSQFFRHVGFPSPQFMGWNVRASYMLLGECRGYKSATGDFTSTPYQGKPAIEIGLRTSGIYHKAAPDIHHVAAMSFEVFANYWANSHLCLSVGADYLDHHKAYMGVYRVAPDSGFNGIDFVTLQSRLTVLF